MVNRLKSIMDPGEKRIRQEDCNEDTLGVGILTLTNKRVAFDKKHARVMDFSGSIGDTILDVPLENITKVWKEGLLMKKVCFTCLLYTSPSPRDKRQSRMPSSA